MIRVTFEIEVRAPLSVVWEHYVNVQLRKKWEIDLEAISFDGPIASGTSGIMQLSGMPPIRFLLSKIEKNREFTDVVDIPDMGKLEFRHEMFAVNAVNHLRQTVTFIPQSGNTGEQEFQFFQTVTRDIAETVFRLKTVVEAYAKSF